MSIIKFPLRRTRGVTLVEMVIFIIIVGIAVAGILMVINVTAKGSADPQLRKQALAIAEGLLEEVESAYFSYCDQVDPAATTVTAASQCTTPENVGTEAASSRPYGNILGYVPTSAGLGGLQANYPITYVNGSAPSGLSSTYSASLKISKATLPGMVTDGGANPAVGSALLITVTVSYAGGSVSLDGYRTQYAPNLVP